MLGGAGGGEKLLTETHRRAAKASTKFAGLAAFLIGHVFMGLSLVAFPLSAQDYSIPNLEHLAEHALECMNGNIFSTFINVFWGVFSGNT